jgi:small subunit ribosomal protein S17
MKNRGIKRQLVGTVVSDKMDKTAVVQVERLVKHPLYKKYIRRRNRFAAHDNDNRCSIGDKVLITESRPISKLKRWRVTEIIEKAV